MLLKSYGLTGKALDWAVQGAVFRHMGHSSIKPWFLESHEKGVVRTCYTDNWAQCGPLIKELNISVNHVSDNDPYPIEDGPWTAYTPTSTYACTGPTPLIAICRCYVDSKLGEYIEIPDVLLKD